MDAKSFQELKNRSIFARLKKLFSDEAVIRNIGGKKLKIADIHNYGYATDRNSLRDRFNRLRTSAADNYSRDFNLAFQRNRTELFRDYDSMDMDPIVHSVLDIYADECTTLNDSGDLIKVYSSNEEIHDILDNLFNDILNVRFNLWSWARSLCKYGDFYLRLFISPEYGIYAIKPYSTYNVTRIENSDLSNKNYVKFQVTIPEGNRMEELENYEMIHFRLLSDSNFLPQGLSILEGGRRVWKQLCLLEDAQLINLIMRAPEKRIFKIDVGNAPQNEIENLMERAMNQIQKVPYVDQATGEYNLRFNMMNMMQDFFIPVRGGNSGNSIDTLKGLDWNGGIDAIEYVKNKMLAAYHVPKAFLGFDESLSGKASLSAEDIRFCRSIQRVQKFLLSGLTETAIIHLYSLGYRDESLLDFSLELTNPSTVFEKEKIEIFKEKSNLCQSLQEQKLFSKKWMYQNIFGLSDQDIIDLNKQLIDDSKTNFRFSQIENEGSDPYLKFLKTQHPNSSTNNSENGSDGESGGLGGDLGGDLSGGDLETDDLFGSETPEEDNASSEKETNKPERPVTEQWKSPFNKHKNHNKMVKKEWDKNRDQTGRKDASKYLRGEDPLGDKENKRKSKLSEVISNSIKNDLIDKNSLKYKMFDENTIDILTENNKKSYMDIK